MPRRPEEDDLPWFHWSGRVIALLSKVVVDEAALKVLKEAVRESRGVDREGWLHAHCRLAEAAALAELDPANAPVLARPVRRGDLVRIRMPKGTLSIAFLADLDETKVWVPDATRDEGRPVLKTFVSPLEVDSLE